ncbi:hypothetical protein V6N11_012778 [Hibiscus sabdariffa]|uniref:Uncharacterized protein n=2 Tax=Hibiscus sabdariffa TaxID=183260 RepID=A0ABR2BRC4_9ROSI
MKSTVVKIFNAMLLLLAFITAVSTASADKQTYIVHMDKTKITDTYNSLVDSKPWHQAVLDSLPDVSSQEEQEVTPPKLLYSYETAFSGFAAKLSSKQLESLKKMDGFVSAVPNKMLSLHTTRSPLFLGLQGKKGLWGSSNILSDVIIGVVDSGIWPEHVSFRDHGLPPVPERWRGSYLYSSVKALKSLPIVYGKSAGDSGAEYCVPGSLNPKLVKGKLVICEQGAVRRTEMGERVKLAGAVGMLIMTPLGEDPTTDVHVLPAAMLGALASEAILNLKYNESQISLFEEGFECPKKATMQPGDLNYPSFAVNFKLKAQNVTFTYRRTVTNVGIPRSTYKVSVETPKGVSVIVKPKVLSFKKLNEKLSYKVSFIGVSGKRTAASASIGSLVWVSGNYRVRSSIAVTWL